MFIKCTLMKGHCVWLFSNGISFSYICNRAPRCISCHWAAHVSSWSGHIVFVLKIRMTQQDKISRVPHGALPHFESPDIIYNIRRKRNPNPVNFSNLASRESGACAGSVPTEWAAEQQGWTCVTDDESQPRWLRHILFSVPLSMVV